MERIILSTQALFWWNDNRIKISVQLWCTERDTNTLTFKGHQCLRLDWLPFHDLCILWSLRDLNPALPPVITTTLFMKGHLRSWWSSTAHTNHAVSCDEKYWILYYMPPEQATKNLIYWKNRGFSGGGRSCIWINGFTIRLNWLGMTFSHEISCCLL